MSKLEAVRNLVQEFTGKFISDKEAHQICQLFDEQAEKLLREIEKRLIPMVTQPLGTVGYMPSGDWFLPGDFLSFFAFLLGWQSFKEELRKEAGMEG